jgi:8-oxo-dGTP pyrophosphatase MutT (NUDIX family)
MRTVKSCGVVVFRREPELSFLTMKLANRFDFPKGHIEPGETEIECALRELWEETGIGHHQVLLVEGFRCATRYHVRARRHGGELIEKTVVYFLGWVVGDPAIRPTEHDGYEWIPWPPGRSLGFKALDEVLAAVGQHLEPG